MYNPLEIRVALNATTNQGLAAYQELAGQTYKQLQDLKQTHESAQVKDSKVFELKEDQQAEFKRIDNPGEESPRKEELWQRHQQRKQENQQENYEPDFLPKKAGQKSANTSKTGAFMDLVG